MKPKISIVVVSFNMTRELPRVLYSLSPPYQKYCNNNEIEIIVVDNGSSVLPERECLPECAKLISIEDPSPSPARAVNKGLEQANADLIGVLIDGARIASPGLCYYAMLSSKLDERAVISTVGFHLGPDIQVKTVEQGYCPEVEDRLLDRINWRENGYRLFQISSFAGSSSEGWFSPIAESNAIFMSRDMWSELGGYDEKFLTPGGGLVNLDTYVRACELPKTKLITLLGEGTFHQVHGGIVTNQKRSDANWTVFHDEYMNIRGKKFKPPQIPTIYVGTAPREAANSFKVSVDKMSDQTKGNMRLLKRLWMKII